MTNEKDVAKRSDKKVRRVYTAPGLFGSGAYYFTLATLARRSAKAIGDVNQCGHGRRLMDVRRRCSCSVAPV